VRLDYFNIKRLV